MGVITALEIQKRNKERVNVYLDGEYSFSLNLMDATRLRKGQTLTDAEIALLQDDDAVVKAVESAVRFLAYRPRSVSEVRRNLSGKSIEEPVIDQALDRLKVMGYLDDEAFARFWVENRNAFKPLGPSALRFELRQKGVTDTIIENLLSDLDVSESAYKAASGQVRRLRGNSRQTFRTKIGSFLQRRGFQFDVSREVIDQLEEELAQDDYFTESSDDV